MKDMLSALAQLFIKTAAHTPHRRVAQFNHLVAVIAQLVLGAGNRSAAGTGVRMQYRTNKG